MASFEWFVGRRYLRAKRKQKFISLITLISILGVAVGVMALIVVLSGFTGFTEGLRDQIIGVNAHALVQRYGATIADPEQVAAKIALIHSECTELLEALRKNKGGRAISDECADIIIRTLDLHTMLREWLQNPDMVPMAQAIDEKMRKNAERPPKHGWVWG